MSTATPTWTARCWTRRSPSSEAFRAGCSGARPRRASRGSRCRKGAARPRRSLGLEGGADADQLGGVGVGGQRHRRRRPRARAHPLADESPHGARPLGAPARATSRSTMRPVRPLPSGPSSPPELRGDPPRPRAHGRPAARAEGGRRARGKRRPRGAGARRRRGASRASPRGILRRAASRPERGRSRAACRPGPWRRAGESPGIRSTPASKDSTSTWALSLSMTQTTSPVRTASRPSSATRSGAFLGRPAEAGHDDLVGHLGAG